MEKTEYTIVIEFFCVTLQPFKKHKKKINGQTYKFECN